MVNIHEPGPFEGRAERWPVLAVTGAMEVRLAETDAEVEAAQRLRYQVFYEEMAAIPTPLSTTSIQYSPPCRTITVSVTADLTSSAYGAYIYAEGDVTLGDEDEAAQPGACRVGRG